MLRRRCPGVAAASATASLLVSALLLLLQSRDAVAAGYDHESKSAKTLTKDTFNDYVEEQRKNERPCLIMFHVSWCKVCQKTFPKFAAASDEVHESGISMDFAHVDCTNDKTLCQRFEVKGYPTIKLFQTKEGADPINFKGQRTEEGFRKYAERMTQPPVRTISTAADLAKVLRGETFAAFLVEAASAEAAPASFAASAEKWRDRHAFLTVPSLAAVLPGGADGLLSEATSAAPSSGTVLAVISAGKQQWPGADGQSTPPAAALFFPGNMADQAAVATWVEKSRFPGIWALGEATFFEFTRASRRTAMVAVDPANVTSSEEEVLRNTADKLKDDYLFGVLDGAAWSEELTDFNIARKELPRVLVSEEDFEAWYEDKEELRLDTLEEDLRGLATGKKQLLRQGRSALQRLQFYQREALRFARKLYEYSQQGPREAALALAVVLLGGAALMTAGWCAMACCRVLLSEDPDFTRVKRD